MKILNRPFLLAVALSLPLWIVFGNFVVAIMAALLISFLLSMYNALRVLKRKKSDPRAGTPPEETE